VLKWVHDVADGPGRDFVALVPESDPHQYKLLLGVHTRPFVVCDNKLGLWYPEHDSIKAICIDPMLLGTLPRPWRFSKLGLRFYAGSTPHEEFDIPPELPPGVHHINLPLWLRGFEELLMVGEYRYFNKETITTIISIAGCQQKLILYPQKWFDEQYKSGWQWIARVTRNSVTGRIVGDGVRICPFELGSDSMTLARWYGSR